jgi:hypothetical protein
VIGVTTVTGTTIAIVPRARPIPGDGIGLARLVRRWQLSQPSCNRL